MFKRRPFGQLAQFCISWETKKKKSEHNKGALFVLTRLTLDEHPSDHDRNEFTALEDDLRRVVQVAQGGIGQAHRAHCQECDDHVGFPRYPGQERDQTRFETSSFATWRPSDSRRARVIRRGATFSPPAFVLRELELHEAKRGIEPKLDQGEVPSEGLESFH